VQLKKKISLRRNSWKQKIILQTTKKQHINKTKDKNTRKECFEKHTIF
jgi:hypothetical protein